MLLQPFLCPEAPDSAPSREGGLLLLLSLCEAGAHVAGKLPGFFSWASRRYWTFPDFPLAWEKFNGVALTHITSQSR